jgi:hypothetical protein
MKSFFAHAARSAPDNVDVASAITVQGVRSSDLLDHPLSFHARARVAVYEHAQSAPRVVDIDEMPVPQFIETASTTIHEACRREGSDIPYAVIREVTENLVHANFAEPVISILNGGETIRFADQGPGIADKERALLPGFTTARGDMKKYIRGVGSGLPLVRDYLVQTGGSICIEDNLGGLGAVVTLTIHEKFDSARASSRVGHALVPEHAGASPAQQGVLAVDEGSSADVRLTARQLQVLAVVLEAGLAGPSLVSKELCVGLSTAYRDLAVLEECGLVASENSKRSLTSEGLRFLENLNRP